ncbi:MAG: hypothetical protein ACTHQ3_04300 [Motilibacteraceae bacterium]
MSPQTEPHPALSAPPAKFAHLYLPRPLPFPPVPKPGPWPWPPPAPDPTPAPPPFQAATYTFSVLKVVCTVTRSRSEDSNKLSLSLGIGSATPQTVVHDMGDTGEGSFTVDVAAPPLHVSDPASGIAFNYLLVNAGHQDWQTVNSMLSKAGNELAAAGAKAATSAVGSAIGATIGSEVMPVVGTVLGLLAGWLVGEVVGILTADCDGPVAAEQAAFKGLDLWNRTQNATRSFTHTTFHPGIDSAAGCGSNSQYLVTWGVRRS